MLFFMYSVAFMRQTLLKVIPICPVFDIKNWTNRYEKSRGKTCPFSHSIRSLSFFTLVSDEIKILRVINWLRVNLLAKPVCIEITSTPRPACIRHIVLNQALQGHYSESFSLSNLIIVHNQNEFLQVLVLSLIILSLYYFISDSFISC